MPRAEISTLERPPHLLSPVRANERGRAEISTSKPRRGSVCRVFTVSRAEISTLDRPAHLLSPLKGNERGLFVFFLPCLGQKSARQRGPLGQIGLVRRLGHRMGRTGRMADWSDSSDRSDWTDRADGPFSTNWSDSANSDASSDFV